MSQTDQPKKPFLKTVDKAFDLLHFFTVATPEFGLSELARQAGLDKATTLRLLNALARGSLVEQNQETKKYRLGYGVLRLARIREATFPLTSVVQLELDRLTEVTGETAHATVFTGESLMTIAIAEPNRSARVYVDPAQMLPLHATASGIAVMAFLPSDKLSAIVAGLSFEQFTDRTIAGRDELEHALEHCRSSGFARAARSFEDDVIGTAAPMFKWKGEPLGAIAVATVASRSNTESEALIVKEVIRSANKITRQLGGEPHPALVKAERKRVGGLTSAQKQLRIF